MPKSSCFQVEIRKSVFATFRKNFLREKKGGANLIWVSERRKYVGGIISQKYASLKVAKYQQNGTDLHINYLANLVLFED